MFHCSLHVQPPSEAAQPRFSRRTEHAAADISRCLAVINFDEYSMNVGDRYGDTDGDGRHALQISSGIRRHFRSTWAFWCHLRPYRSIIGFIGLGIQAPMKVTLQVGYTMITIRYTLISHLYILLLSSFLFFSFLLHEALHPRYLIHLDPAECQVDRLTASWELPYGSWVSRSLREKPMFSKLHWCLDQSRGRHTDLQKVTVNQVNVILLQLQ